MGSYIKLGYGSAVPDSVDWDFGDWENIYVPGDPRDPWRSQDDNDSSLSDYPHPETHWGAAKDGSILLRVYEDALPPGSMADTDVEPRGYNIRNNIANALMSADNGLSAVKVVYGDQEYELKDWMLTDPDLYTYVDMPGGTLIFDEFTSLGDMFCRFVLDGNVNHDDPKGIDVFNQKLTMQATFNDGSVATRDILVQIVDDVPIVSGEAIIDMSGVAAWTLAGEKLPLSYDYLKDTLYRSVDYNDWATGFKVTKCEGKYGSIGVFGDDGNPDDPNSAPGAAYYMVDPAKIATLAPDQVVSEVVEYTYTDSDGDTTNGVLNIVLKGTGLNPSGAIDITPRPGNVPTSGGDIPADNPYVPGNPNDPDRDLNSSSAAGYDPMNPNWGLAKDGQPLLRVFESGLPNGSEAGQRNIAAHGYLDIDATVGLKSIIATTDGLDSYSFKDNMMAIPLDGGTLTFTQNPDENYLKYEFTLTNPVIHDPGDGINSDEQYVQLIATDNFGNEEIIDLEVQIIDDVPKSHSTVEISAIRPAWSLFGPAWPVTSFFSLGADYVPDSDSFTIETVDGLYGSFSMYETELGGWSIAYDMDREKVASISSGETVIDTTKLIYTDSDGDSSEVNVSCKLVGPGTRPRFTVNETDLSESAIIDLDGYEILGVADQGRFGTVFQGEDGLWRYMLKEGIDSGAVQGTNIVEDADFFHLKLDGYGHMLESEFFAVDIIDSVPTFTASQNRLAYDFGADNGPGSGLKVAVGGAETDLVPGGETMIAGQHGMLTLSADGSCHYAPNSDYAGEDRFDFTITDSDGDRALATVVASMVEGAPQTVISVQTADELAAAEIAALGLPSGDSGALIGA